MREARLKPAYYSTSSQSWTIPESYLVDVRNNRVSMQIDRFTDCSQLSDGIHDSYLPIVAR